MNTLPSGVAVGLGGGLLLRGKSNLFGALCGVSGLCLGHFTEWKFAPFAADPSFSYFITHLHKLDSCAITLIMIAVGGLIAEKVATAASKERRNSRVYLAPSENTGG
jgi:hypothetical protein